LTRKVIPLDSLKDDPDFLRWQESSRARQVHRLPGNISRDAFWQCFDLLPAELKAHAEDVLTLVVWAGSDPKAQRCLAKELAPKAARALRRVRSETDRRHAVVQALKALKQGRVTSEQALIALKAQHPRFGKLTAERLERLGKARCGAHELAGRASAACGAFDDADQALARKKFEDATRNKSRK
jgi:hypothetical protein